MTLRTIAFAVLLAGPALADYPKCDATTQVGTTCSCDLQELRPLQGALGFEEVASKAEKIRLKPEKQWRSLAADPIKVVQGPGGALYGTDHHHGADAWRLAQHATALCKINALIPYRSAEDFWSALAASKLVHLEDADGRPISHLELPGSLAALPDDRYRSLAWRLRKEGGFCRAEMQHVEFAEFVWADWLRSRIPIPAGAGGASTASLVPAALKLALGRDAAAMPGYVGAKPAGFQCPPDD